MPQGWFEQNKPTVAPAPEGNWFAQNAPTQDQGQIRQPLSAYEKLVNFGRDVKQGTGDVLAGMGSGVFKTGLGVSKLVGAVPKETTLEDIGMQPRNATQEAAMTGEQIGEFFLPSGAIGKGTKAVEAATAGSTLLPGFVKGAVNLGAKAGMEAASAGAITAAQQGSTENVDKVATTAAVLSAALPAALKLGGKLGVKIESTLIKPTKVDIENGFRAENVFKYKIGGTLEQTLKKAQEKIDNLTAMARKLRNTNMPGIVKAGQTAGPVVNIKQALADAAQELKAQAPRNQGLNQKILGALDNELRELDILVQNGQMGQAGETAIDTAHEILQGVGERGAWTYGFRDPDAVAAEKVANLFYSKLRQGIEDAIPDGSALKAVNKAMSEIIPIKQAIIRRIPVEARNQALHLSDIVSVASGNNWLALFNRALRSGRVANTLVGGSENAAAGGASGARLGAGVTAQEQQ